MSHKDILQANIGVFTGLLVLLSFVLSFVQIDTDSQIRLWADFTTKLVLGLSSILFVASIRVIINYNLKESPSNQDEQDATKTALELFKIGCLYLAGSTVLFVFVHEFLLILETVQNT